MQTYIEKLESQKNCPASLEEAYQFAKDVYPNIAQILKILLICPASGAVVERGFSLMNMQMNKLGSPMKIWTLDALMRIHYMILPIRVLMMFGSKMETDALTCHDVHENTHLNFY